MIDAKRAASDTRGVPRLHPQNGTRFTRIMVNGVRPLAARLQDYSTDLFASFISKSAAAETGQLVPVQMSYAFTASNKRLDALVARLIFARRDPGSGSSAFGLSRDCSNRK